MNEVVGNLHFLGAPRPLHVYYFPVDSTTPGVPKIDGDVLSLISTLQQTFPTEHNAVESFINRLKPTNEAFRLTPAHIEAKLMAFVARANNDSISVPPSHKDVFLVSFTNSSNSDISSGSLSSRIQILACT